jgi:phage shock protein PspC (stress-responsive transcriptional regulator)
MKTSININLFGTLFAIDEDAHQLLQQYLDNMKSYFSKQEGGDEISDDIEHRVAELFWELKQKGSESISIEQVRNIIQEIGNPEELGDEKADSTSESNEEPKGQGNETKEEGNGTQNFSQQAEDTAREAAAKTKTWFSQRRYYRDPQNKMVGGVLSGLAHYFGGGDPLIWRIVFVLVTIFSSVIPTIIPYILLWLCAPEAKTAEERLRMMGKEVTPENIKSQVLGYGDPSNNIPQNNNGCLSTGLKLLVLIAALPVLFIIGIVIFALIAAFFGVIAGLFGAATGITAGGTSMIASALGGEKWTLIAFILAVLSFITLLIYTLYRFFHRDQNNTNGLNYLILLALMIIAGLVGWATANRLSQKIGDIDWGDVMGNYGYDIDDIDDEFEDYGSTANCDSIYVVPAFDKVNIDGIGKIIYRQGDSCSVAVKAKDYVLKHTIVEVRDGQLTLALDDQIGDNTNFGAQRFYITAPNITELEMHGVGTVDIEGNVKQDQPMSVKLEGVGKIDIDEITCPKLSVINKGAGKVDIKAYVDSLIVSNEGVGAIDIEGRAFNYQRNNEGIGAIDDDELKIGM